MLDGGVEIDGQYREQRIFGYSVGRWVDDNTLEVQTLGTLPEDRVWLDSTGRPISDQVKVTETFRRVSLDELEWSETIDDPKIYTKPWETMKLPMRLHDPAPISWSTTAHRRNRRTTTSSSEAPRARNRLRANRRRRHRNAALACAFASAVAARRPGRAAERPQLAEEVFKNVQLLKGIPVKEFMGTMGMFSASLGLNCTDCHVEEAGGNWARYADDTDLKRTSRRMMTMVDSLNKSMFGGRRLVSCYSCHRGTNRPQVIPELAVQYGDAIILEPDEILADGTGQPTAEEILDRYIQAIGGAQRAGGRHQLRRHGDVPWASTTIRSTRSRSTPARPASAPRSCMAGLATSPGRSMAATDGWRRRQSRPPSRWCR